VNDWSKCRVCLCYSGDEGSDDEDEENYDDTYEVHFMHIQIRTVFIRHLKGIYVIFI